MGYGFLIGRACAWLEYQHVVSHSMVYSGQGFHNTKVLNLEKVPFSLADLKKTDSSDNTWRHHNPTSPAPEVIRGRWTIPNAAPATPYAQRTLHSSPSRAPFIVLNSGWEPRSPSFSTRADGKGFRSCSTTGEPQPGSDFCLHVGFKAKGSNFSVEIKRQVWHLWRSIRGLNAQLWVLCCLQPTALAVTFPKS